MSLLNDMLHDLEKRSSRKGEIADIYPLFLEPEVVHVSTKSRGWTGNVIAGVVVVGLLVTLGLLNQTGSAPDSKINAPRTASAKVAVPTPVATMEVEPVTWPEEAERKYTSLRSMRLGVLVGHLDEPIKPEVPEPHVSDAPTSVVHKSVPDQRTIERSTLHEAKMLAFRGDRIHAKDALHTFLSQYPDADDSRFVLVGWLVQDGEWDRARKLLHGIDDASDPRLRLLKARVLLQQKDIPGAITLLDSNMPELVDAQEFHALRAALLLRDQRFDASAQAYAGLLEVDVTRGDWWGGLAVSLDQTDDRQAALVAYRQAIQDERIQSSLKRFATERISLLSRWEG